MRGKIISNHWINFSPDYGAAVHNNCFLLLKTIGYCAFVLKFPFTHTQYNCLKTIHTHIHKHVHVQVHIHILTYTVKLTDGLLLKVLSNCGNMVGTFTL